LQGRKTDPAREMLPSRFKPDRVDNPKAKVREWGRNLNEAYRVEECGDDVVLMHRKHPGHRSDVVGEQTANFGWRIIPRKKYFLPIAAMVRLGLK